MSDANISSDFIINGLLIFLLIGIIGCSISSIFLDNTVLFILLIAITAIAGILILLMIIFKIIQRKSYIYIPSSIIFLLISLIFLVSLCIAPYMLYRRNSITNNGIFSNIKPTPTPTSSPLPLPNPFATSVMNGSPQKLYFYNNNNNSFTKITVDNIDSKISDVSSINDTIYYVLDNNKLIATKVDASKNTVSINEYIPNLQISKLRPVNNGFYALSKNNGLYFSNNLRNWNLLYSNVTDFDIPYNNEIIYGVKSDKTSFTLDPITTNPLEYFNIEEYRIYGRNKNEYVSVKEGKLVRNDGKIIEGGIKGVYDSDGNFHVISANQKIDNDVVKNVFGSPLSVIYQV
jgi:hypothetical protein